MGDIDIRPKNLSSAAMENGRLYTPRSHLDKRHSFLYPEEDSSKDERNLAFEGNSNLGVDGSTSFEGGVFSVNHLYKTHRGYSSSDLSIPAVAPKYYKELTFQEDDASDSSPLKAVPDFINMAAHQASPDLENENLRARISNGHLWNDVLTDISNVLYDVNWRADLLDGESSPFNFYGVFSLSKSDKVWGDQSPAFVLPPKNESSCGKDGAHHHHYPHSVGCNMANMTVVFKGHPKELFVQVNSSTLLDISNLLPKCKYDINGKHGSFHFTTPYNGCYVKKLGDCFVLNLVWKNKPVVLSCPAEPTPILLTFCQRDKMTIVLPEGPLDLLKVKDRFNKWITAYKIAHKCKYLVWRDSLGRIVFSASFKACHVMEMKDDYVLTVSYKSAGATGQVVMSCPVETHVQHPYHYLDFPNLLCAKNGIIIHLPKWNLQAIQLKAQLNKLIAVKDAPKYCRYHLVRDRGMNLLTASYLSCDVKTVNYNYVLPVFYTSASGKQGSVNMECPATTGKPRVICRRSSMTVYLPKVPIEQIRLRNHHGKTVPIHAAKHCHYILMEGNRRLIFTTSYKACDVQIKHRHYILTVVYTSDTKGEASVEMKCPVEETETIPSQSVTCGKSGMTMLLPKGSPEDVKIIDYLGNEVAVRNVSKPCQYMLEKHWNGSVSFTAHYRSCDVKLQGGYYMLTVLYKPLSGPKLVGHMRCPASDQSSHTPHDFPVVICESTSMMVELPVASDVKVLDADKEHHILGIAKECGYKLREKENTLLFTTTYDGCHVRILDGHYSLTVVYRSIGEEKFWLQMKCPVQAYPGQSTPPAIVPTKPIPYVTCKNASMTVMLPDSNLDGITVKDMFNEELIVNQAPVECGYSLVKVHGKITLTVRYTSCDVTVKGSFYVLTVIYAPEVGQQLVVNMKCPNASGDFGFTTLPPLTSQKPSTLPPSPTVFCQAASMMLVLPGLHYEIQILDLLGEAVPVSAVSPECGYVLRKVKGKIIFTVPYDSCEVSVEDGFYVLTMYYTTENGQQMKVHMKCPTSSGDAGLSTTIPPTNVVKSTPSAPPVTCNFFAMSVMLPEGSPTDVLILDFFNQSMAVNQAPNECGYTLRKAGGKIVFSTPYDACDVYIKRNHYVLNVLYSPDGGMEMSVTMRCPIKVPTTTKMPSSTSTLSTKGFTPIVICRSSSMMVTLPDGSPQSVGVLDALGEQVAVTQQPSSCGYTLIKTRGNLQFTALYKACDVQIIGGSYVLDIMYQPSSGPEIAVQMECPTTFGDGLTTITTMPSRTTIFTVSIKPTVICSSTSMTAMLPDGSLDDVQIIDLAHEVVPVTLTPQGCGYALERKRGSLFFFVKYTACDINILNNNYVLTVLYKPAGGSIMSLTMSCPVGVQMTTMTTTLSKPYTPSPPVTCGESSMSVTLPYGPLDQVKIVSFNETVAVYQALPECGYILRRVGRKMVLKVPYDACDVYIWSKHYELTIVHQTSTGEKLKRHMMCPVQRIVAHQACTADGHFVFAVYRTASKPEVDPATLVVSGNQSCLPVICTPEFAIFKFPVTGCGTYVFVPLSFLLGKTVYLELLLVNPPEPNMVLLVHYCIAYPRSSMNAWVLIYEGCPRNESAVNLILKDLAGYPLPKYIRRFNLQTFQFLDPRTWKHLDEEVG
ncbi:ZP2 protein, partial [Polypterus senegalus]